MNYLGAFCTIIWLLFVLSYIINLISSLSTYGSSYTFFHGLIVLIIGLIGTISGVRSALYNKVNLGLVISSGLYIIHWWRALYIVDNLTLVDFLKSIIYLGTSLTGTFPIFYSGIVEPLLIHSIFGISSFFITRSWWSGKKS